MNDDLPTNANGQDRRPPGAEPVAMSFKQMEDWLLARLQDGAVDRKQALRHLARFYADRRCYDQALERMRELVVAEDDLEEKAAIVLATGGIAEMKGDFEAAVRFYREAFAMEPEQNDVWFFVNNNLGFSLNKLGRFTEGEKFCRSAIQINSSRPNGFKNLGIALAGQGQLAEAARCWVTATKVAPGDTRSHDLLKNLLRQHPELANEFGPGGSTDWSSP
jgi:tetratricopeptide (TPR) repeat protein